MGLVLLYAIIRITTDYTVTRSAKLAGYRTLLLHLDDHSTISLKSYLERGYVKNVTLSSSSVIIILLNEFAEVLVRVL